MTRYIAQLRRPRPLALALVLLAGCQGAETTEPEPTVPVQLVRISAEEASCQGSYCGYRITIGTTHAQTGEKVAVSLRLSGDGRYSRTVNSTLPDGTATVFWEFLSDPGEYKLFVCPDGNAGGNCLTYTATRFLPT